MLRNNLIYTFIISLLLPLSSMAYFNKAQRIELDRKVFKTEQHLKTLLTKDLKSSVGVKELLVDVKVEVNKRNIYNEVTSLDDKLKKIEDMQLPSLFIDADQQKKLKEVKNITIENVLGHIRVIQLTISTPYDVVDQELMKKKVTEVLASNYYRTDKIELKILFSKTPEVLKDNRDSSLTTPNYTHVVSDLKKLSPYMLTAIAVMFVGLILFLWMFKNSMKQMTSAIDDIEVSGNLTANLEMPKSQSRELTFGDEKNRNLPSASGENNISSYIELVDKIRYLVKKNKSLVHEMISLHFHLGEVNKILILLNILDISEREELYKTLPANHLKDLKKFVVNEGELLYQDELKLNGIAQEIFRVISIANVKPESFYQIYLKKIIISLSANEIANVIRACNSKELMYFLENVDGVKLAFVSATHDLGDIDFKQNSKDLNQEETKKFVHKLAKFIYVKDAVIEGNGKAKLIPHLSEEMEAKYIESMGLSQELSFKNLVSSQMEVVQEYVKNLSFEDINDILALFNEELQKVIVSVLPDLVAERLESRTFTLNENSFVLKIDLYTKLKETHLHQNKENVKKMNEQLEFIDEEYKKLEEPKSNDIVDTVESDDNDVA